jgi:MYXO-CTERM domain-containing protein
VADDDDLVLDDDDSALGFADDDGCDCGGGDTEAPSQAWFPLVILAAAGLRRRRIGTPGATS